jgi:hypothetical protein
MKIPDWLVGKAVDELSTLATGNPKKEPVSANDVAAQFGNLIIRSVIACYAVWGVVAIADLAACESRRPGQCEAQRSELRGAATTIPATLLAWLADSPVSATGIAQKLIGRKPRQTPGDNT